MFTLAIIESYLSALKIFWDFLSWFWWLWLPILLFFILENFLLVWRRNLYKKNITWITLEIRVPREIKKTPMAMEQVLANIYGTRNAAGDWVEKYIDGEVTRWLSLEMTSFGGEIHFYIRCPKAIRQIAEASLYAQYPELEIAELTEDYVDLFPKTLAGIRKENYDLWGSELVLQKDDTYPIRTYAEFAGAVDEKSLDPISALLETLNKIKTGENILIQLLIRPATRDWREKGLKMVKKLRDKEAGGIDLKTGKPTFRFRSPGEEIILKTLEQNLMKPAYETVIRYVYIAKKNVFKKDFPRQGIISAFNQYSSFALNNFRHNYKVYTEIRWNKFPFFFRKARTKERQKKIWHKFRERKMPEENIASKIMASHPLSFDFAPHFSTFNIEELATIYHFPSYLVATQPLIKRVESRKMAPPVGLAIFTEEKEIKL